MFLYNILIKHAEYFNVNLNVLFYASTYGIIAIFIIKEISRARSLRERMFYFFMLIYPATFVLLNLFSIGVNYEFHISLVVNKYIDIVLGALVVSGLITLAWLLSKRRKY